MTSTSPKILTLSGKQRRQKLKDDFLTYAPAALRIRTKAGQLLPFNLNRAQQHIHSQLEQQFSRTGKVRALILKGRQQGSSTYVEGRYYWKVSHRRGVLAFILTHEQDATNNIFAMANRYHANCPDQLRPHTGAANAKELYFSKLDSGYKVATAGTKGVGRSSTIQYFHGSEVSFWPNAAEHAMGAMQAIPDAPDTEVILESTANGIGNYFHQQWQMAERGESEYLAIFVPWFWQPEYAMSVPADFKITDAEEELKRQYLLTDGQLVWRRKKIIELAVEGVNGEVAFKQEYPCNPTEAFQSTGKEALIRSEDVMSARMENRADRYGPILVGVDPARFGEDHTAFIRRQGRVAYGLERIKGIDTMSVVGRVHTIIRYEKPDKVFIDVGGLGAGIVDRLREMGFRHIIVAVNAGNKAINEKKYANRRAEMWAETNIWLKDGPVQIPNSDVLHADLCTPGYDFDSKSRLLLESKESMRKRGIRSPDAGDALALTFAERVGASVSRIITSVFEPADTVVGY